MAGDKVDPTHQFMINKIVPIEIGGYDVSFTNASLFMVATLVVAVGFLYFTTSSRSVVPGRMQSVSEMSYEFIASRLRELAPDVARRRVIAAHLGNGASLCAMMNGGSVDTTMGFTALDGLVMGTRSGNLDPGVIRYLEQQHGMTAEAVEHLLYNESGLLGVSGISSDMRALLASSDSHAREAIELFVFRIAREIGALTASLGGVDGIVFTAGIGEHSPGIRAMVARRLGWLGVELDETANARGTLLISMPESRVKLYVVPTSEETMIARHTLDIVRPA